MKSGTIIYRLDSPVAHIVASSAFGFTVTECAQTFLTYTVHVDTGYNTLCAKCARYRREAGMTDSERDVLTDLIASLTESEVRELLERVAIGAVAYSRRDKTPGSPRRIIEHERRWVAKHSEEGDKE